MNILRIFKRTQEEDRLVGTSSGVSTEDEKDKELAEEEEEYDEDASKDELSDGEEDEDLEHLDYRTSLVDVGKPEKGLFGQPGGSVVKLEKKKKKKDSTHVVLKEKYFDVQTKDVVDPKTGQTVNTIYIVLLKDQTLQNNLRVFDINVVDDPDNANLGFLFQWMKKPPYCRLEGTYQRFISFLSSVPNLPFIHHSFIHHFRVGYEGATTQELHVWRGSDGCACQVPGEAEGDNDWQGRGAAQAGQDHIRLFVVPLQARPPLLCWCGQRHPCWKRSQ